MDFGFNMPSRGPQATRDGIFTIARRAEQLGYNYLAVTDHIVVPRDIASRYPYSQGGEFPGKEAGEYVDPLSLMAFLAAATEDIRLMTSVLVLPYRPAVMTAKMIATIDVMSAGRITIACGAGWMREEFEALNLPDFDARGRVTDEYLRVMKALWAASPASFEGEFIRFADVSADPKPVQRPHPPIWVGGESMPAIRRTVALGDAWYPFGSNPKFRMDTLEAFVARRDRLYAKAEEAGRDPGSIGLTYNCCAYNC